jgi:RecA-family ATPase
MELGPEERATVLHSVCVWDVCGEQVKLVRATDGNILLTELADKIVDAYQDDPPIVVVFDPLVSFGASEGMVNDNEQAIVTAARRIVKGLDCCVRVIHHTGKANARDRTLDQYSGRGGSALADGSRMTTVLQTWSGYDGKSQLQPPAGCTPSPRSSITILSRAKLSYSPPGLPLIWIKRTGYTFEHFVAIPVSPEQARAAKADQLERFLTHQISIDRYHNKTSLESECRVMQMSRQELRDALAELQVSGRVVDEDLPKELKYGNRRTYLRPVHVADPFGEIDAEEPVSPPPNSPGLITSPPYRERTGGEITPPVSPPAPCISPQGNGEIRRDWRDGEEAGESEEPELEVLEL